MKKVNLNINGRDICAIVHEKQVLLDLLRDTLGLTGTKQSRDRKGQCGDHGMTEMGLGGGDSAVKERITICLKPIFSLK